MLWPNGWMNQDTTWYTEVGLGLGHVVLDEDPSSPQKGGTAAPNFRPMSIVANMRL